MNIYAIYISFLTLLRKEVVRILRIWPQSIIPPVITTTLYFLIFGKLIGSQVEDIEGNSFIAFIVPGLIMSQMLANAYINSAFSVYAMRFVRSIEEILVSPTPYPIILLSFIFSSIARGLITAIIITIIAMFFTPIKLHHAGVLILVAMIASFLFGTLGVINGLFSNSFDDVAIIPTFVITPLTYLGGVFYSIDMLPDFLQKLTIANPIYYIISAFRYGFLGYESVSIIACVSVLIVMTVASFMFALKCLNKTQN